MNARFPAAQDQVIQALEQPPAAQRSPSSPSRRSFVIGSAAAGTGLAVGLPLLSTDAKAADSTAPFNAKAAEIGVWVVVKPDDTIVIRMARSEMGQGTITGLAQLVAEELECNWKKVTYEYPTPGESVRRKRAWGDFSTGGSRGIRTSHEYVRKGGAAARMMLVQAVPMTGKFR